MGTVTLNVLDPSRPVAKSTSAYTHLVVMYLWLAIFTFDQWRAVAGLLQTAKSTQELQ